MKVFFLASVTSNSNKRLLGSYHRIIAILDRYAKCVVSEHVFEEIKDIETKTDVESATRATNLLREMLGCDAVVFEATCSSTGAGYMLSRALSENIPSLFISEKKYKGLYLADPNRLLVIKQYNPKDSRGLELIIKSFIKFAKNKRLSVRFNLMISDSTDKFITDQSKMSHISKAQYIRNLIYQKMINKDKKIRD